MVPTSGRFISFSEHFPRCCWICCVQKRSGTSVSGHSSRVSTSLSGKRGLMSMLRRWEYSLSCLSSWVLILISFLLVHSLDAWHARLPFCHATWSVFAILRSLHICDNSTAVPRGQPGHDRALKIRSMITSFVTAWQAAYKIGKSMRVDECMVPFQACERSKVI